MSAERSRLRPRLTGRAAVLFVLVLVLGLFSVVPVRQLLDQRGRIRELERRAALIASANSELEERIARLADPEVIERIARECLGMVKPGEIAFVVVPKGGEPNPSDC